MWYLVKDYLVINKDGCRGIVLSADGSSSFWAQVSFKNYLIRTHIFSEDRDNLVKLSTRRL